MDVFSIEKRSEVMSQIRGRDNRSTERRMTALLRAYHISGWRVRPSEVTGHPDIYFPDLRIAIFLDGCFWHACPKCFKLPEQNRKFWAEKIRKNKRRDREVNRVLKREGIKVVRIWEHDLRGNTPRIKAVLNMLRTGG